MPTISKHFNPQMVAIFMRHFDLSNKLHFQKRSDMEIVKKLNAEQEFDHMIAFGFLSVLTSCCTFAVFFTGQFFLFEAERDGTGNFEMILILILFWALDRDLY